MCGWLALQSRCLSVQSERCCAWDLAVQGPAVPLRACLNLRQNGAPQHLELMVWMDVVDGCEWMLIDADG